MQVISTNSGKPQIIEWKGKLAKTGIYKYPTNEPIFLGKEDVKDDHVIDRRYHGGIDKACYLFSADHYNYWKNLYPELNWQWGMFGENLTVENLNEADINIGDVFKLGDTIVQATQPRQPCFKLGVRLGSQKAVKQFVEFGNAGVYVRILETGKVKAGDTFELIERNHIGYSIRKVFQMIYSENFDIEEVKVVISDPLLAESCRVDLKKIWGI
ncbi:MAG: MOSC domain-containing protein [Prolixibacteraceae bacterium]|nr:MOSC domain-containing protein [Prolixibacteraceae bacterium]